MSLNEAHIFVRVVESKSFTAAARSLQMPKSTVSRRVAQLEERLGVRLMQRTTRHLNLTPEGEVFYARAAEVVAQLEDAEREVMRCTDEPRGVLRVTAPNDLGALMGELVAAFVCRFREVDVQVELTQRRVDLIEEGFDVALRGGHLEDSSLVARQLTPTQMRMHASPAYLARRGTPTKLGELAEHDCVLFGARSHDVWRFEGPDGAEEVGVHGRVCANDLSTLRSLARHGAGVVRLPSSPIHRFVDGLVPVLPEYQLWSGGLYAVYPSQRHLTPRVRHFVDMAAEITAERPPPRDASPVTAR